MSEKTYPDNLIDDDIPVRPDGARIFDISTMKVVYGGPRFFNPTWEDSDGRVPGMTLEQARDSGCLFEEAGSKTVPLQGDPAEFCPQCGNGIGMAARFCPECGAPILHG